MKPIGEAARGPVSTYSDALQWLITYSQIEEWLFDGEAEAPKEVRLVSDMFWLGEGTVIRDLRRLWNTTLDPRPVGPRRSSRSGWR